VRAAVLSTVLHEWQLYKDTLWTFKYIIKRVRDYPSIHALVGSHQWFLYCVEADVELRRWVIGLCTLLYSSSTVIANLTVMRRYAEFITKVNRRESLEMCTTSLPFPDFTYPSAPILLNITVIDRPGDILPKTLQWPCVWVHVHVPVTVPWG
jgi:hypothetical protein